VFFKKTNNGLKKYAVNTSFLAAEQMIRSVVLFIIWVFVIRYLGPHKFGILSYGLSFVYLFHVFSELGVQDIAVREIVNNPDEENIVLGSIFLLRFTGALFAIGVIAIVLNLMTAEPIVRTIITVLSFQFLFKPLDTIQYYFQAHVSSQYIVYSRMIAMGLITLSYVLLLFFQVPLSYFPWVIISEFLVYGACLVSFYHRGGKSIVLWRCALKRIGQLLGDTWPLIFASVAVSIYMRIDQIMIKNMLDANQVGIYSVAVRISEVFYLIPMVVTRSLFPAIVKARAVSQKLYTDRINALLGLLMNAAVVIAVLMTFLSVPLVELFFGAKYLVSAKVITVHIWACVFVFITIGGRKWIMAENLQIFALITAIIGAVSNVLLNLWLIPDYGVMGAAVATVISTASSGFLAYGIFRKTRPIFLMQLRAFNPIVFWRKYLPLIYELRGKNEE